MRMITIRIRTTVESPILSLQTVNSTTINIIIIIIIIMIIIMMMAFCMMMLHNNIVQVLPWMTTLPVPDFCSNIKITKINFFFLLSLFLLNRPFIIPKHLSRQKILYSFILCLHLIVILFSFSHCCLGKEIHFLSAVLCSLQLFHNFFLFVTNFALLSLICRYF